MRCGFKTFVSFAIGVLLATSCTAQNRTTTSVSIRCHNGRIVSQLYGSQHCECNVGFTGYACDQLEPTTTTTFRCINGFIFYLSIYPNGSKMCVCNQGYYGPSCEITFPTTPPPIRCVNGVISGGGIVWQRCLCNPGFAGAACDRAIPTTPPPIRCVNGISSAGTVFQRCKCNPGFTGAACDRAIPTIRCVNGVITGAGTLGQYCECYPGFTGTACDQDKPGTCPILPPDAVGLCAEMCGSDNDCPGSQKCCSQGCGHSCYNPAAISTTLPPIRCVNGVMSGTIPPYCICNLEFTGEACDMPTLTTPPPIRCVNGVIARAWTVWQHCVCSPGFIGAACDYNMPLEQLPQGQRETPSGSMRNDVFLIVGVSVGALILVAVVMAVVFVCKRRQRFNNETSAAHARRLPPDLRTGVSQGIYAISGRHDVMLPPYTPPKSPPPYDHPDYIHTLSQPPPYYTNPGYETMSSVRMESVRDENVSVKSDNVISHKAHK